LAHCDRKVDFIKFISEYLYINRILRSVELVLMLRCITLTINILTLIINNDVFASGWIYGWVIGDNLCVCKHIILFGGNIRLII
jgi:hypothetical protein